MESCTLHVADAQPEVARIAEWLEKHARREGGVREQA
jgi:hypothetical protein